jgi:hypothetical protein
MTINFTMGRMIGGAITGAVLTTIVNLGGVWVIVGMALSGMESSIQSTNSRIDDIRTTLATVDGRIFEIQGTLNRGFSDTRTEIRNSARLDSPWSINDGIRIASKMEARARLDAILGPGPKTLISPTPEAWVKLLNDDPNLVAATALTDQATLANLTGGYIVSGITAQEIIQRTKESLDGYRFTTEGGVEYKATFADGTILIESEFGTATVEGIGQASTNLSTLSVNSAFRVKE